MTPLEQASLISSHVISSASCALRLWNGTSHASESSATKFFVCSAFSSFIFSRSIAAFHESLTMLLELHHLVSEDLHRRSIVAIAVVECDECAVSGRSRPCFK